jgi:hypothetical protein
MFNPEAEVRVVDFDERRFCIVIDDALLDPEALVADVAARHEAFRPVDFSAYPGVHLPAPAPLAAQLEELFSRQIRRRFDARRCLHTQCRFSMITLPAAVLKPYQWLCHVDDVEIAADRSMQACVLYLFRDVRLGGTSFYDLNRPPAEIAALFKDARHLDAVEFRERHGIRPGYQHQGNEYFRLLGTVEARWNRLIFYDGGMLHAADIVEDARLSDDPRTGRLTLNGFFTCRRHVR